MKTRSSFSFFCVTCVLALCAQMHAGPVTDWHTFKAMSATELSGQGTSSPVLGHTTNSASTAFLVGYFNPLSLTNVGDRIAFTYQLTFTDAAGIMNAQDNFRFALFDLNGQTPVAAANTATAGVDGQTDDWRGYWFGVRHPTGVGSIRERTGPLVTVDNIFAAASPNNTTAPSLLNGTQVQGSGVTFVSSTTPEGGLTYTGLMGVERTPTGIALAGYFGGNGATNLFIANDDNSPFPANYGAVAFLNGGPLNCDQINFQNVSVNYVFSNALAFVTQPISATATVGQQIQFSASWTGSGIFPRVQWLENGIDIPDATNATYTIPSVSLGQDGFTYSVVVSNVFGDSITSTNATLSVVVDTTAPTVLSVSSLTSNSLNVIFSEPVDPNTAQNSGNYVLTGNSFSSFTQIGGSNILITVDNLITENYTLTVQNVQDLSGNTMTTTNMLGIAHGYLDSFNINASFGTAFALNEKPVLYSNGLNIFDNVDSFHYVYKTMSGDFDIEVRVESLLNTHANARAGLMARLTQSPDSRNVLIEATPGRFIFQYRTNTFEGTETVAAPRPPTSFPNNWIRLVRSGSVFTGYSSTNHVTWDLISSHDTAISPEGVYPNEILIGLVASSGNVSLTTRAEFSGFGPTTSQPAPPTLTVANVGSSVEVSWPLASLGVTLQATPSLTPTVTWTNIPGSSATNRVFVPSGPSALFFRAIQ